MYIGGEFQNAGNVQASNIADYTNHYVNVTYNSQTLVNLRTNSVPVLIQSVTDATGHKAACVINIFSMFKNY